MGWTLVFRAVARRTVQMMTLLFAGLGMLGTGQPAQAGEATTGSSANALPIDAASCQVIPGIQGPEDVTFDPDTGTAFVSSDDRRSAMAGKPVRGEIFRFDPTQPAQPPLALTGGQPGDFHPHGISLYRAPDGKKRLFVINHRHTGGNAIEIYDVVDGSLKHAETVQYPELSSPNDILAVGERQFYATNDARFKTGFLWLIEALFARPWASVSYYDGKTGSIAARRLKYANGINISADGKTVYVAEVTRKTVSDYTRDSASGALTLGHRTRVKGGADNIELDAQGRLWVAAHPDSLKFLGHARSAEKFSPVLVVRITPSTHQVETVMSHDGSIISAVATAAVSPEWMLLGGVFDPKLLLCRRPD